VDYQQQEQVSLNQAIRWKRIKQGGTMNVSTEISRRQLLQGAVGGALLLGTSGAVGGIASSVAGASSSPKKGGTLRAGIAGGSSSDTMNALTPIQTTDFARTLNLFEMLTVYGPTGKVEYLLAESMVPNATATAWTIHLRPGVTWHNGKKFTADDVIYTFRRITNPKSPMPGAPLLARVNVAGMRRLNDLTVYVPCHTPY
jgi:peptide/nickel transport system substrate-binding protein